MLLPDVRMRPLTKRRRLQVRDMSTNSPSEGVSAFCWQDTAASAAARISNDLVNFMLPVFFMLCFYNIFPLTVVRALRLTVTYET